MRWLKVTPSGLVWSKKLRAAMSSLWAWAAAISRGSSWTGPHGVAARARASLTSISTWSTGDSWGGVVGAGVVGGAVVSGGADVAGVLVVVVAAAVLGGTSAVPVGGGVVTASVAAAVWTWSDGALPSWSPVATATPRGAAQTSTNASRSSPGDGR